MDDDSVHQVRRAGAGANPGGVVDVDVGAPGEVQGDMVRRQRRDRVEQFQHALVRQPVADAQHGDPSAPPQIAGLASARWQVAPRLDHQHPRRRQTVVADEPVAQRCARHEQQVAAPVERPVERALQRRAQPALPHPTRGLVEDRRERAAGAGRATTHGATDHAVMLSTTTRPRARRNGLRSPMIEMNSRMAFRAGAASAIRRW